MKIKVFLTVVVALAVVGVAFPAHGTRPAVTFRSRDSVLSFSGNEEPARVGEQVSAKREREELYADRARRKAFIRACDVSTLSNRMLNELRTIAAADDLDKFKKILSVIKHGYFVQKRHGEARYCSERVAARRQRWCAVIENFFWQNHAKHLPEKLICFILQEWPWLLEFHGTNAYLGVLPDSLGEAFVALRIDERDTAKRERAAHIYAAIADARAFMRTMTPAERQLAAKHDPLITREVLEALRAKCRSALPETVRVALRVK